MNSETGEVLQYHHSTTRGHSIYGLKKTFANLRRLLNNNLHGNQSELFVTLTYNCHMTDTKRLYIDFKNFWLKLKYYHPYLEYINVCEPQASGTWHCHTFLIRNDKQKLYIPQSDLSKYWGHGFVFVERIRNCNNIGAYFSARFTDVDLNENCHNANDKKIAKGKRLFYYPANFRFYRCSRGIERPVPIKMPYHKAIDMTKNFTPSYSYTNNICLVDDDGVLYKVKNITYEQFTRRF